VDVAGWYWMKREINLYADANDIKMVTRKINGGLNGLIDRIDYFERAQHILI
jgi:putative chitinase